jgi:SNF2 family DNA or RNA helicase
MKYFSQVWLLDKGERFGNYITAFRERYFTHSRYTMEYALMDGAAEAIEERIADIVFVLMREDRNLIIHDHPIRLPKDVMEQYREFEATAVLEIPDSQPIDAITGAALSNKLLQFAGGAVYGANVVLDETGEPVVDAKGKVKIDRFYHVVHDEKIEELKEIVEQTLDQPLLVAYWFKSSLDRLKKVFPDAAVMDREGRMEEPWNQRKFKMMLVHPRSVGHGMNLQFGGHHLVVFDIFWPLDLFLQLIGRLDRQGQLETVIVHMLSCKGTMDETVTAKLQYLEDAQTAMFARLRALRDKLRRS